jgi:hypothetical protein
MTVNISKPAINVREKLSELDKPTGIAGEAMLRAETPQEQFNLIGAGRRNLIINGAMQVAQRGTTGTKAADGWSNGYLSLDRWGVYYNDTVLSQEDTIIDGRYVKALKVASGSGDNARPYVYQKIEGGSRLLGGGQPYSLSFWAKAPNGGSWQVEHRYSTNASAGSGEVTSTIKDGFAPSSDWTYYKFEGIVSVDTSQNYTRDGGIWFEPDGASAADGRNEQLWLAEVQLELGKVATPFEHRSYGEELALCQRYFYQVGKAGTASTLSNYGFCRGGGYLEYVYVTIPRPVFMRSAPAVSGGGVLRGTTFTGGYTTKSVSVTTSNLLGFDNVGSESAVSGIRLEFDSDWTTGDEVIISDHDGTGFISFDAEL